MTQPASPATPLTLRHLPMPIRLVLAVFLLSVGVGYFSALVQLHFAHAKAGEALPTPDDAAHAYGGHGQESLLYRLIDAPVSRPFNGTGTMRPAFTTMSAGWDVLASDPHQQLVASSKSVMERLLEWAEMDRLHEQGKALERSEALARYFQVDPADDALAQFKEFVEPVSFNGDGTMRTAFFHKSGGWTKIVRNMMKDKNVGETLLARDNERVALLSYCKQLAVGTRDAVATCKKAYDEDKFPLDKKLESLALPEDFLQQEVSLKHVGLGNWLLGQDHPLAMLAALREVVEAPAPAPAPKYLKVKTLINERCTRCHDDTGAKKGPAAYPLASFEQVLLYGEKSAVVQAKPIAGDAESVRQKIVQQREGERRALLAWVAAGTPRDAYEQDRFKLTGELVKEEITETFVETTKEQTRYAKVQSILEARCVRCHVREAGGSAAQFPLDTYERVAKYAVKGKSAPISLPKLAQTSHVHLLGFSMLFGLTGVIFCFSSYPSALRVLLGPWPLLAQILDIACWWLARVDEVFGKTIAVTGGIVALGLAAHIVLSLLNMFGKLGKVIVMLLLLLGALGIAGLFLKVIKPHLEFERAQTTLVSGK